MLCVAEKRGGSGAGGVGIAYLRREIGRLGPSLLGQPRLSLYLRL
jgi:hypothetical protein